MPEKCDVCGCTTALSKNFAKERKLFRKGVVTFCPHCWQARRASRNGWLLVLQFAMGLAGLIMACRQPDDIGGWLFLNLFFFLVFLNLGIVPHELGHAFFGKWMGWRVFRICIGSGKRVWKTKLFGIDAEFRPILFSGLVLAAPPSPRHYRIKMCAYALAGPMANLVLAAIAFVLLRERTGGFLVITESLIPVEMFLAANLALMGCCLVPWVPQTPLGKVPSDGMRVWLAIRAGPRMGEQGHASWFMMEGAACREAGRFEEAARWFERGLEAYPKDMGLLSWHGLALLDRLKFAEARECFEGLVAHANISPLAQRMMKNNVAYVDVLLERADLMEEADRYSLEAMESLAWHPAIKGTRGAVLTALRKFDQAVPLLRSALEDHDNPRDKAGNACWLAIAEAQRRNASTAQQYFDEARRLDSTNSLLDRAQRALAQP